MKIFWLVYLKRIFRKDLLTIGLKLMFFILLGKEIGRTTREFLRQLALKNGYILNLHKFNSNTLLDASIKSIVDSGKLEKLLYECLSTSN